MDPVSPNIIVKTFLFVKDWTSNFFWLLANLKRVRDTAEKGKVSDNARLCPDCDTRMKLGREVGEGNYFDCPKCKTSQWYKTRH